MSNKPEKERHGTSHHQKAIYQYLRIPFSRNWEICYKNFLYAAPKELLSGSVNTVGSRWGMNLCSTLKKTTK